MENKKMVRKNGKPLRKWSCIILVTGSGYRDSCRECPALVFFKCDTIRHRENILFSQFYIREV